jgi:hypothetical protein
MLAPGERPACEATAISGRVIVSQRRDIRPEHLSSLLTNTAADFSVVIGDKNERNGTVHVWWLAAAQTMIICPLFCVGIPPCCEQQARSDDKLLEAPARERINAMAESWTARNSAPLAKIGAAAVSRMRESEVRRCAPRIQPPPSHPSPLPHAHVEQLFALLSAHFGIPGAPQRLAHLMQDFAVVHGWRLPTGNRRPDAYDMSMISKLTSAQTHAIRLDRELVRAAELLSVRSRSPPHFRVCVCVCARVCVCACVCAGECVCFGI